MANAAIFNALMGRPVRSVDDYLTQYENRDAQKAAIQQNALAAMQNQQLREAQIGEIRARQQQAVAEQQAKQQQEAARRAALLRAGPVTGIQANAASGITGPTPQAAAAIGQRRPVNVAELLANDVPPEQIKLLAEAGNLGRAKVARQIEVDDGKGGKRIALVDDYGNEVAGMAGYVAPVQVNQGNQITFARPQAGVSLPVGMSPSEADSSRRGWAGLDIQRQAEQRQAEAARLAAVQPPKLTPAQERAEADKIKGSRQAEQMMSAIDQARDLLGAGPTASGIGAGADAVGRFFGRTTDSGKTAAQLETLSGWMVANVPRMEGPQSNFDIQNYQIMAAKVGDRSVPVAERTAALETLESLHRKYADINGTPLPPPKPRAGKPSAVPRISGDAEYNALPSGAEFIGPDGKTRRKP